MRCQTSAEKVFYTDSKNPFLRIQRKSFFLFYIFATSYVVTDLFDIEEALVHFFTFVGKRANLSDDEIIIYNMWLLLVGSATSASNIIE